MAATYTGNPTVNILNGTVSGNVYGGGKGNLVDGNDRGVAGKVTGNPAVTIGDNVNGHTAIVLGDVYGGGDAADVAGTPVIVVNDCNTQVGYLYGGGNAADVNGTNITINGGTFNTAFGGGHGDKAASSPSKYADVNGNVVFNVYGGTFNKVFAGSNSKGDITGTSALTINKSGTCAMKIGEVYGGGNEADGNAGTVTIGCTGALTANHANVNVDNNTTNNRIGYELEGIGTVYGGANQANIGKEGTPSNITLNINSGMVANVFGGNNTSGTIYGTITVNIEKTSDACGWYVGNVFGGGNLASYTGSPTVNVKNGTVTYNVYGGGKGSSAVVTGSPTVIVGDLTLGNEAYVASVAGDVYGGGDAAGVTGNTTVTIQKSNTTVGNAYGGGNAAVVTGTTSLTITNGTSGNLYGGGRAAGVSSTATVTMSGGTVTSGVYGGCNTSGDIGGNITVNMSGGVVGTSGSKTDIVFGGGYGEDTGTTGNVTVTVTGTTIHGNVYGGSALGAVNDDSSNTTTVNINGGIINGNIYGGGLGQAGDDNVAKGQVNGTVTVNIGDGTVDPVTGFATTTSGTATINGSVYGCNNTNGSPKGNVTVNVYRTAHTTENDADYTGADPTYAIDQVFGGGNKADYVPSDNTNRAKVHIYTCDNTIRRVFGGGNAAAALGVVTIIDGGRFEYVFGGGNGEVTAANIGNGGTKLTIHGGKIIYMFGGSNTSGTITGPMETNALNDGSCAVQISDFFCGNNEATIGTLDNPVSITATIECGAEFDNVYGGCNLADIYGDIHLIIKGGVLGTVYGGSKGDLASLGEGHRNKAADIHGNVTLTIEDGHIGRAFGGSNVNGNITGEIEVNLEWKAGSTCTDGQYIGNIYGGSNMAEYTPTYAVGEGDVRISPVVNIKNGTVSENVFGGGLGATATVTANPVVTIGDDNPDHYVAIDGDVYGGGDAGNVIGTTQVNVVNKCNSSIGGDVYGGGNAADVNGTDVNIDGGVIAGRVFGGGHGDKASLNVDENDHSHSDKVANVNGNTSVTITGGTISKVFAGSNINGTITGTSNELTINSASGACDMKIGEVYGGGNLAAGNATTISVGCTGELVDGADGHLANPNNIGTTLEGIGTVYGGANQADVSSDITLNITGGIVGNAFGGNNTSGGIDGSITVNVEWGSAACDNYLGNVYGGGNLAAYSIYGYNSDGTVKTSGENPYDDQCLWRR